MGVEFYSCDKCGEVFPDCGPHSTCGNCSVRYCEECSPSDSYWINEKECVFCRGEIILDCDLLNFIIEHLLDEDRETMERKYREFYGIQK